MISFPWLSLFSKFLCFHISSFSSEIPFFNWKDYISVSGISISAGNKISQFFSFLKSYFAFIFIGYFSVKIEFRLVVSFHFFFLKNVYQPFDDVIPLSGFYSFCWKLICQSYWSFPGVNLFLSSLLMIFI